MNYFNIIIITNLEVPSGKFVFYLLYTITQVYIPLTSMSYMFRYEYEHFYTYVKFTINPSLYYVDRQIIICYYKTC